MTCEGVLNGHSVNVNGIVIVDYTLGKESERGEDWEYVCVQDVKTHTHVRTYHTTVSVSKFIENCLCVIICICAILKSVNLNIYDHIEISWKHTQKSKHSNVMKTNEE